MAAVFTFNDGLTGNTTTATATVPGTVVAGDVLAVVSVQNTGAQTHSISGGGTGAWTVRSGPDDNASNQRSYVWTKTAQSDAAGASVTITSSGSGKLIGIGTVVSGVLETGLQLALTTDTTADTSLSWSAVTIPDNTGWTLVGLATLRVGAATAATMTAPTGSTIDGVSKTVQATPNFSTYAMHGNSTVASGSQTPGTGTASAAVTNQLYTLAFAPGTQNLTGTLAVTSTGSLSLGATAETASGSLAVSSTGTLSLGGKPAGVGSLSLSSTGTLSFGVGKPAVKGSLAITSTGTLSLFAGAAFGTLTLTSTGSLALGAILTTVKGSLAITSTGTLTFGGKPFAKGVLILTGAGTISLAKVLNVKWWDGASWVTAAIKWWNGSSWIPATVKVWDGTQWS